ncbi:MAG: hypothetical protein GWO20_08740, partial [Candidatus Korarchaeota archaeon]|nr:hypothetical protein [Candidatus Korarchaeota archaeon]
LSLSLFSILLLQLLATSVTPVSAFNEGEINTESTTYEPGCEIGQYVTYNLSTSDMPEEMEGNMTIRVVSIVGTNVTFNMTQHALNTTSDESYMQTQRGWTDVHSGNSSGDLPPFIIAGNLTKGDPVYPEDPVSINDTVFKRYAESVYTVNKLNVSIDSQPSLYYWHQSSGFLMELQSNSTSSFVHIKAIETNLVGDETSPFVRIDTPTAGTVINTTGDLTVEWTGYDNETEIAYYLVYFDGVQISNVTKTTHMYTFTNVANGTHTIMIEASDLAGNTDTSSVTISVLRDTDQDGMPDPWEEQYGLDPETANAGEDPDDDGLTNLEEYNLGTNPTKEDTDDDGMPDGWEVEQDFDPTADDAANQCERVRAWDRSTRG